MTERPPHSKALSSAQERRLVDYLDEQFLQLARGFKKRSEPSSPYPTLLNYLGAASKILALVLQIPPIDPSTALRTAYLLRLTNDILSSIPGYVPLISVLEDTVSWLDDLDQAWLVALQSQVWDPNKGTGVDLVIEEVDAAAGVRSTPMSQTEITRLRSLLVTGMAELEEWLGRGAKGGEVDIESKLQRLGLQDRFDELFSGTLDFLGDFGGFVVEPLSDIE
ncbi:hypothetical protein AX15_005198 [Amanita polypyramis BW_CC]|nr:hypothetical protein AX15_005198 [Amanita polypyramis BW_CC]